MLCNTQKPPFDDINFRKAVAYGIDRDSIAKDVFFGLLHPATVPAPPGSWWYDDKADHIISYNMDKAREFLKKSKYPDGAQFDVTVPSTPYLLDMRDAAVVIQAQLAEAQHPRQSSSSLNPMSSWRNISVANSRRHLPTSCRRESRPISSWSTSLPVRS